MMFIALLRRQNCSITTLWSWISYIAIKPASVADLYFLIHMLHIWSMPLSRACNVRVPLFALELSECLQFWVCFFIMGVCCSFWNWFYFPRYIYMVSVLFPASLIKFKVHVTQKCDSMVSLRVWWVGVCLCCIMFKTLKWDVFVFGVSPAQHLIETFEISLLMFIRQLLPCCSLPTSADKLLTE